MEFICCCLDDGVELIIFRFKVAILFLLFGLDDGVCAACTSKLSLIVAVERVHAVCWRD